MTVVEGADAVRLICLAVALVDAVLFVRVCVNVARRPLIPVTRLALLAFAVLVPSAAWTEYLALGTEPTLRILLNVAGLILACLYLWAVLRLPKEKWDPPGYDGQDRPWWPRPRR